MSSLPKVVESPPGDEETFRRVPFGIRLVTAGVIIIPFLGLTAAAYIAWGRGFNWVDLGLLLGMYLVTGLGITVGFHRLFTHHSFETYDWVKFILAVFGSMAIEAPLFKWVAVHRRHHQHSDKAGDPHSPHLRNPGLFGWLRGYWHAHCGWIFDPEPTNLARYARDLQQSLPLRVAHAMFFVWVTLGLLIPATLGGLLTGTWLGFWTGLIWGGLARIFLVHHVTWSVNSACHLWGLRPFRSNDESRNNFIFGVLALGEGWHNTHHAFPTSARHGLPWWQLDISYWVIRALALVGLAWNVKIPSKEAQEQARKDRFKKPARNLPPQVSSKIS